MEIHQLRVFRAVADAKSIAGAARILQVTPSAVSQVVAGLQTELDVALTRRVGRSIEITEAGQRLASAAVDIEIAVEKVLISISATKDSPTKPVSVCAFHSAAMIFFPFLTQASDLAGGHGVVCVDEDVPQEEFPNLTSKYDLVIAHRMSTSPLWPLERVSVTSLVREPLDVVISPDHPLARQDVLNPWDLMGVSWVSSRESFPPDDLIQAIAAITGSPALIKHRINDIATSAAVVQQGGLCALMPRSATKYYVGENISSRPLSGIGAVRHIDALIRPEKLTRPWVRDTLDRLQERSDDVQRSFTVSGKTHGEESLWTK